MKPTEQELHQIAVARYEDSIYPFNDKVDAFKEGFREAISQMQPEWVSVTERLPERHVDVLVFFIGAWKNKPVYKVDNYTIDGFWQNTSNNIITHWTELPQPPKETTK